LEDQTQHPQQHCHQRRRRVRLVEEEMERCPPLQGQLLASFIDFDMVVPPHRRDLRGGVVVAVAATAMVADNNKCGGRGTEVEEEEEVEEVEEEVVEEEEVAAAERVHPWVVPNVSLHQAHRRGRRVRQREQEKERI